MNQPDSMLLELYRKTLHRTSPSLLFREFSGRDEVQSRLREPVSVIALGKCASGMFKGLTATTRVAEAFAAFPGGYLTEPFPAFVETAVGNHPEIGADSFSAGEALLQFAERAGSHQVVVLLSGGTSATVASPLVPFFTRDDLTRVNDLLVRSGLPIEKMNTVRKHLSGIKGGRLAEVLPAGCITLVLSDVSRDGWRDVGSGPTLPDETTNAEAAEILQGLGDAESGRLAELLQSGEVPETPKRIEESEFHLVADNDTLVKTAREEGAKQGLDMQVLEEELNQDVDEVAERLTEKLSSLRRGKWIAAGGEPTVRVSGEGRGGRCSELAVRLGLRLRDRGIDDAWGLLASSDGLDGTAEAAGFVLCPDRYSERGHDVDVSEALARSDSVSVADRFAIPIPKNPSGNNLRDIFVVGRV